MPAAFSQTMRSLQADGFRRGHWGMLLVGMLAAGGLVTWLLNSDPGTRWALQRVPGLQADGVQGRLLGGPDQDLVHADAG